MYHWLSVPTAQNLALLAGFEPARGDPNGFLVHRLNHSATTTHKSNLNRFEKLLKITSVAEKKTYSVHMNGKYLFS